MRRFYYLPLGPRFERLFGTSNLAQLVQAHKFYLIYMIRLCGAHVTSESGIFEGDPRGISFGLCTDGVNPFSHLRCTYSKWPIVLSLLNLPRNIRHDFRNMFLVGIIPGNGSKEAYSIHPYLEVLVDELISLSNAQMYDTYKLQFESRDSYLHS